MIDIHTHILPGVDDGASDFETSIAMAQIAQESGVTDMIVTPHSNQRSRYENYVSDDLEDRMLLLRTVLEKADVGVNVHRGMEVFGTPDVPYLLRQGRIGTLAGSRYLLVEFALRENPFFMEDLLRRIRAEGVEPIVAHPERYHALQNMPEILFDWCAEGFWLQVNKSSFFGSFGSAARRTANLMLAQDLAAIVASDAHGAHRRTPDLSRVQDLIATQYSHRQASRLLENNPQRILRDEPLLPGEPDRFSY